MPRLCELYPGLCLSTVEKQGKTSVRVVKKCNLGTIQCVSVADLRVEEQVVEADFSGLEETGSRSVSVDVCSTAGEVEVCTQKFSRKSE